MQSVEAEQAPLLIPARREVWYPDKLFRRKASRLPSGKDHFRNVGSKEGEADSARDQSLVDRIARCNRLVAEPGRQILEPGMGAGDGSYERRIRLRFVVGLLLSDDELPAMAAALELERPLDEIRRL